MTEATLARQLRQRQYAAGYVTVAEIDALDDAELIDCYNPCAACGAKALTELKLRVAIARARDVGHWLSLVQQMSGGCEETR